ncbi:hypothetical protein GCM10022219_16680 [Microbacterium oryzae]|uniref:hypothetical protein n=1 Tax=Microbacterium oryzae TaxID=743009 RepID=UPI0012E0D716|nr:hypothetical protein [Microbacterium oryzae]
MSKSPRILLTAALAFGIVAVGTPALAATSEAPVETSSASVEVSVGGARVAAQIWDW